MGVDARRRAGRRAGAAGSDGAALAADRRAQRDESPGGGRDRHRAGADAGHDRASARSGGHRSRPLRADPGGSALPRGRRLRAHTRRAGARAEHRSQAHAWSPGGRLRLRRRSRWRQAADHGRDRRPARRPDLGDLRQPALGAAGGHHRRDRGGHPAGGPGRAPLRAAGGPPRRHRGGAGVGPGGRHRGDRRQGTRDLPDRRVRRSALRRSRRGAAHPGGADDLRRAMPVITVQEIVRATQGALVVGDLAIPVSGVSIDSRTLGVGEAFFAIRGHRLDGHAFVVEAASRGASCLVVHHVPDPIPAGVPLVLVEDTTKALGRLAAAHRAKFDVPAVAVTGSNGKTTTKEMLAAVLGQRWRVLKSESSFNNQWGLPLTLLRLGPEHEALVVEIGTNQRGEIAYLSGLTAPPVGVVTTVAAVHTEFLGALARVREEKAALGRARGAAGCAALNPDDPRGMSMTRETAARILTYGRAATAAVRAVGDVGEDPRGLTFTLEAGGARQAVTLGFVGRHNLTNALAAAAARGALGFSLPEIARRVASPPPRHGRRIWP